jgi:hypothetical protein
MRRPFLLEPGESLLVPRDPLRSLANHIGAAQATGICQSGLVASRMSEVPIPLAGGREGSRRVPGVRPESMWWPLLWLPPRLAYRVDYQIIDGDVVVIDPDGLFGRDPHAIPHARRGYEVHRETVDVWAVRVFLEVEAAGLYDADSGTWLDVLASYGIDIGQPDDLERVSAWLEGASDAVLDEIDETFLRDGNHVPPNEDPTWAFRYSVATYADLLNATWAYGSETLRAIVDDVSRGVAEGEISEAGEACFIARMVCQLSIPLLRWYTDDETEWWSNMLAVVDEFEGVAHQLVHGPLTKIDERLSDVERVARARMETAIERYSD